MSDEIKVDYQPGESNLYCCVFNSALQVRDITNSNWETFDDSQIDNYDIPLTEAGDRSGVYKTTFPILDAGVYIVKSYQGDKSDPNDDDGIGAGIMYWNGIAEINTQEIRKLLRADKIIDTTETPWIVDYFEEGTTESPLMSKTMKTADDENITSVDNVLGRLEQE